MTFAGENSGIAACEFQPGNSVSGYEVINLIGHGSMGNVYRVRHTMMQEEYALKTLRAEKLTDVTWKRFQIEAQSVAKMNHPNIVTIYNFGLHEKKIPFYVMALVEGKSISELVDERGPLPADEMLPVFIEVCKGLGYAHQKNIIHRDIKPANIVVLNNPQGGTRVKIVDFGIAKITGDDADNRQNLTNIGEVCGSPLYMSPEQCEGGKIDFRSDIYSLGCTLYEALTGAPPFHGRNVVDTMLKHQSEKPMSLKAATKGGHFHPMLERVVAIMLAKSPDDRYQSMAEAAQDLQAIVGGVAAPQEFSPGRSNPTMNAVHANMQPQMGMGTGMGTASSASNSLANAPSPMVPQGEISQDRTVLMQQNPAQSMAPRGDRNYETRSSANHNAHLNPRPVYNPASVRAATYATANDPHEEDDGEQPFGLTMPSHFVRLMVGSFIVICLLLAALGYWWIAPSAPGSHSLVPGNPSSAADFNLPRA